MAMKVGGVFPAATWSSGLGEKFRQMLTASVRAYRDGRETSQARHEIVTHYLNSTPLGSWPGYGEVIGVPEALWIWYGTDPAEAEGVLTTPAVTKAELARKGEVYRQVLSLLLAGRRPAYYLNRDGTALAALSESYLRLLAAAGVIDPELRDSALAAKLHFRKELPPAAAAWFVGNKATDRIRNELVSRLHAAPAPHICTSFVAIRSTGQMSSSPGPKL